MQSKGAQALTDVELIQAVIGSGTQKVSAARIAKNVKRLLDESSVLSLHDLLDVKGLGVAKAAQIVAAIELGRRLYYRAPLANLDASQFLYLPKATKRSLEYVTINGAGEIIETRLEAIESSSKAVIAIRKMFADCLHDHASSLKVGIGSRTLGIDSLEDTLLEITKTIFETANLLGVKVSYIEIVNHSSQRQLNRKSIQ